MSSSRSPLSPWETASTPHRDASAPSRADLAALEQAFAEHQIQAATERISRMFLRIGQGVSIAWLAAALCHYGLRDGLLVSLAFGGFTSLTALLGWLPLVGPVFYAWVARQWALPFLFASLPTVHPSWVTETYFWYGALLSVLFTLFSLALLWPKRAEVQPSPHSIQERPTR